VKTLFAASLALIGVAAWLSREEAVFAYRLFRAVGNGDWEVTWK